VRAQGHCSHLAKSSVFSTSKNASLVVGRLALVPAEDVARARFMVFAPSAGEHLDSSDAWKVRTHHRNARCIFEERWSLL